MRQDDLIQSFAAFYKLSENVHWFSSTDFKEIYHISPGYENIWNRRVIDLYNYPRCWITHLMPEDANRYHPIDEMAKRVKNEGPHARYDESYRIIVPSGETRWILDKGQPIYDDNGNCLGVSGVAIDVTVNKLLEKFMNEKTYSNTVNQVLPNFISDLSCSTSLKNKIILKTKQGTIRLTKREIECILEILKGKTSKEIGKTFNRSFRTIEHITQQIKFKFNCKTRSQLIDTILNSELMSVF